MSKTVLVALQTPKVGRDYKGDDYFGNLCVATCLKQVRFVVVPNLRSAVRIGKARVSGIVILLGIAWEIDEIGDFGRLDSVYSVDNSVNYCPIQTNL